MVSEEHAIRAKVEKAGKTKEALDTFMSELETVLDLREHMIAELQDSVTDYRKAAAKFKA